MLIEILSEEYKCNIFIAKSKKTMNIPNAEPSFSAILSIAGLINAAYLIHRR
jgi:hypothetical protein